VIPAAVREHPVAAAGLNAEFAKFTQRLQRRSCIQREAREDTRSGAGVPEFVLHS
jgi:hypothetical protein